MRVRGLFGSLKFWLAAAMILICQPALADKRVALVLGNSAYQNVPPLANPINDAALMAATLKRAGFDTVDSRQNLTALETRRALREFADKAANADIAVIYYAGHGIEVDGNNYLIPVDAKLERDNDVYDEAFSLDRILVAVEPVKKLRLVILDACRDNPFAQTMKKTVATRAIGRGLAIVEPASPNSLIAYSAKAGSTSQDGDGKNSPFTVALANHLTTPGLDVRRAFGFVRDDVRKATFNRQEPYVYGSLGGDDVPLVPAPASATAAAPAAPASAPNPQADVRRDYELALQVGNKQAFDAFLAQHPDGFYANLAKLERDKFADDAKAAEQARLDAERKPAETIVAARAAQPAVPAPEKGVNLASLDLAPNQSDINKSVQTELRRVGCYSGNADGDWDSASQRSLSQFNRSAGMRLDVKTANADTLDTIRQKSSRVCPLVCDHGFKADGDRCSRIVCAEGSFVNSDNECEKQQRSKPTVKRDDGDRPNRRVQQDRQDRQERQSDVARPPRGGSRYGSGYDAGYGAMPPRRQESRPLTGTERAYGCNSNEAIMSGKCPN